MTLLHRGERSIATLTKTKRGVFHTCCKWVKYQALGGQSSDRWPKLSTYTWTGSKCCWWVWTAGRNKNHSVQRFVIYFTFY